MRLTRVAVTNHSRIQDLDIAVRGHLAIVGANDVGKSSLLRLLHLTLGASTAQLYSSLTTDDLRDTAVPMSVRAVFGAFSEEERRCFHREIDIHPGERTETLELRLEVTIDPEDDVSVIINRWCPGRGEVRAVTREQLQAVGWRHLSATRGSSAALLDGPNGAIRVLLGAVEAELGDEKASFGDLLGAFNDKLAQSPALTTLRGGVAGHLSTSMPRAIDGEDLAVRTATDPTESVFANVSLFLARDDGTFASMDEQSDGIRQLMAMTLFDLAEGAANIVAIDEPELHLHPLSQRTVARLLTDQRSQKLVVTHSPYVVHRFDPIEVVAVGPDSRCRQIDPEKFPVNDRAQAHWWSPRMLEALTARFVVLVEGVADRLIVESAASASGVELDRIGATIFELGGAENFRSVYRLLGPDGFGTTVLGLVDQAESAGWVGTVGGKPKNVVDKVVFISDADLEEEYCRGIGPAEVANRLIAAQVAPESGILSSCGAATLSEVTAEDLAKFCRSSSKTMNRKVPSALAVAKTMTAIDAASLTSINSLLSRLKTLST